MLLPQFNNIVVAEIEPQLKKILTTNLQQLDEYLALDEPITWETLIPLIETLNNRLQCFWSPIQHLHAVNSTPELRAAYQACLPLLTDYHTHIGHHEKLFAAIHTLNQQADKQQYSAVQRRILTLALRDFHLSGVDLSKEDKQRYADIEKQLAELTTHYGEHVLDATQQWYDLITDQSELTGLPPHILQTAQVNTQQHQQSGWRLTLDYPCYNAVMKNAEHRPLREKFYQAYVTRASELGDKKFDNTLLMNDILQQRHALAELLGYQNYAELSLATKMAESPQQVVEFLNELVVYAKPKAQQELAELQHFAGHELAPWDIAYYAEKLQQQRFHIQQETLRPYFPAGQVISGLFNLVKQVFGLSIQPFENPEVWHSDVHCYTIVDQQQQLRGIFYLDLYVRPQKREGAWMDDYCARWRLPTGELQYPVAYLTCNFTKPQPHQPALLTHDDIITLFHEFGHGLHHLLSTVEYLDVSGLHNVPWDAVEFPSQFMENWCWQPAVLKALSSHYQSNEPLPDNIIENLIASRHFHAALQLVRQLEFALIDFNLHLQKPYQENYVQTIVDKVRAQVSVIKAPNYNRSQHKFTHIFDGGYAAGYYSYLWAEVLASDAFEAFEEQGVFNQSLGQHFIETILAQGGSQPPQDLFKTFRGRAPDAKALLRAGGLIT